MKDDYLITSGEKKIVIVKSTGSKNTKQDKK